MIGRHRRIKIIKRKKIYSIRFNESAVGADPSNIAIESKSGNIVRMQSICIAVDPPISTIKFARSNMSERNPNMIIRRNAQESLYGYLQCSVTGRQRQGVDLCWQVEARQYKQEADNFLHYGDKYLLR